MNAMNTMNAINTGSNSRYTGINEKVLWISLDPRRKQIDEYPKFVANKIESVYQKNQDIAVLGPNFYNATICLYDKEVGFYQRTLAIGDGRNCHKPQGFRSVRRIVLDEENKYTIEIGMIKGEWQIVNYNPLYRNMYTNVVKITECVKNVDNIISSNIEQNTPINQEITYWKPEDIKNQKEAETQNNEDKDNKFVVVWKWCNATYETHGSRLLNLDDSYWIPYLYEQNKSIEEAFKNRELEVEITLPIINVKKTIHMKPNSCYAKQHDYERETVRHVRRTIMRISDLHERLLVAQKLQSKYKPNYYQEFVRNNPNCEIPHEFMCPISLMLMKHPVKTCDGFTYDKENIAKWLSTSMKSPLTGLELQNDQLVENDEVKNNIDAFLRQKCENTK